ncbi:hypothetical protein B0H14DRAFT_3128781 [Mycena olivaceomarginata]|nr:hypothetical protein B0H14DRAFT_3128781 [Mycena olivaceomarginata]
MSFSRMIRYFFLAGLAVLIYDHLLTLGTEVKFIWSSKLRASTCWFLAVRYIALSANIAVAVYNFGNLNHESCVKMLWARNVLLLSQETLIEGTAGTRVAILVCDIIVFALTFRRAIQGISPLHQRLATDGSMYFGIIVLANLANVLTFYLGDGLIPGFLSWFTTRLSVTLVSRLMLNLHEVGAGQIDTNTFNMEPIRFTATHRTSTEES